MTRPTYGRINTVEYCERCGATRYSYTNRRTPHWTMCFECMTASSLKVMRFPDGAVVILEEDDDQELVDGWFECPCGHTDGWIGTPEHVVEGLHCPECDKPHGVLYRLPDFAVGIVDEDDGVW